MKAKVVMINWTRDPIETMAYARRVMHSPVPDSIEELKKDPTKWLGMSIAQYFNEVLSKDGMPTFQEYVLLTFKLENVSRAFQQQLTRNRIGFSYSIQSLRCVNLPEFAVNKLYHNPFENGTYEYKVFTARMEEIQDSYTEALDTDMPTQDARGLLPMNVYSTITFSCTLRAFIGMINKRLCHKVQGEFSEVARLMVKEVKDKLGPKILEWIGPPCDKGWCMLRGENEQQLKEGKLTGKQNTDYVCPIFKKKFK